MSVSAESFLGLDSVEAEGKALHEMAALRGPVDAFFDQVMVMAEDPALRNNRLALLSDIAGLFGAVADFSMISA